MPITFRHTPIYVAYNLSMVNKFNLDQLWQSGTWRALTAVEQKYQYFRLESYTREGWEEAQHAFGEQAVRSLQRIAVIAIRPESILGRKGSEILQYMRASGFRPVIAQEFRYDRRKVREIWRFQWNTATLDRMRLSDLLHTFADSLLVFFIDDRPERGVPGSVRLAGLKGSSIPWERQPHHLRSYVGAPNRMMVFVHCCDEPIDIARELSILLELNQIEDVYRRLNNVLNGQEEEEDVEAALANVYARCPEQSLNVQEAADRIRSEIARASNEQAASAERAEKTLVDALAGNSLNWRRWSTELHAAGLHTEEWDPILVGTHYIQHDHPGERSVISDSGREHWQRGEGLLVDD